MEDSKMNIAIIGAGAMGCLFGVKLNQIPQNNVVLVDIWERHIQKINADGLRIDSEAGTERFFIKATATTESLQPADLVIIFTKSHHTRAALAKVQGLLKADTLALTLQNGLGNSQMLARYVPMEQILVGTTTFPSDIVGPGRIRTKGGGITCLMSADGVRRPQTDAIADMFHQAGLNGQVVEDIDVTIWEKVALNAALNSLCAITRLPVGAIGATDEGRRLAMTVASEVIAVANRKGINADKQRCHAMIEEAFTRHRDHQPSMLQDILSQRRTEIDAIAGAVVREASQLGLSVPATAALADLVTVIQKNYDGFVQK
jgi:2-dehydropantoate 2-reductase